MPVNQKHIMLPSFEIFLSILSDSWMPWLADNRKEEKFESLLFALTPFSEKSFQGFFSKLIPAIQNTRSAISPNFTKEAAYLSKIKASSQVLSLAPHFVQLPAVHSHELFYHSLTGFASDGYQSWLHNSLPAKDGEIGAYILTRTIDRLYSVLKIPVMDELATERDLRLLYVVKVALAGIHCGLMQRFGNFYRGLAVTYRAPDSIRNEIKQSSLSPDTREELFDLLKKLLPSPVVQTIAGPDETKKAEADINKAMQKSGLTPTNELEQLAQSWNNDVLFIKKAVGQLKDTAAGEQTLPGKTLNSGEVMRLLGISKSTLYRHRKNGTIKFNKIGGKFIYMETEIMKLLKQQDKNHK